MRSDGEVVLGKGQRGVASGRGARGFCWSCERSAVSFYREERERCGGEWSGGERSGRVKPNPLIYISTVENNWIHALS